MEQNNCSFCFEYTWKGKVSKYIGNLDKNNSRQKDDILVSLIKENKDLFCHFVHHNFDNSLLISKFQ